MAKGSETVRSAVLRCGYRKPTDREKYSATPKGMIGGVAKTYRGDSVQGIFEVLQMSQRPPRICL